MNKINSKDTNNFLKDRNINYFQFPIYRCLFHRCDLMVDLFQNFVYGPKIESNQTCQFYSVCIHIFCNFQNYTLKML